uniref:G-protein coupled receptors family 1 profile domain-containing protein n=1 Tax=Globodera rostochiensis TaxID=31243 RepID=A0A914HFD2_GLORO
MDNNNNKLELPPNIDDSANVSMSALPQQLPLPVVLVLSVPAILIILLTVFGNLLVLFFKARVGRTNTTLLVWNLGLTDFMVGVLVLPMGASYLLNRRWVFGQMLCRIWVGADVTFCTCSVVTICIISVDRYLAVTRPLRYKSVVTKLKVITVIILIWTFSLGILLATVRWESHQKTTENKTCYVGDEIRYLAHSVVFAFFLPASVTLTLYWRIYSLARNRQRALDRGFLMILGHNMNFLTNTLSQTTALRVHIGKNNGMVEHQRRVLRTHERIAKTLGVVSCSFLFCWLPFFTLYLLNHQCENCVPPLVLDIASWLGYCNSMLNPIIYSFTVKEFKRSAFRALVPIWRWVHGWCPKIVRKPPDASSTHRIARKRQQQVSTTPQQHRPPAAGCNATNAADARRRRMPTRERPSRARAGAIASLMVNTNCSIMQNTMTAELINRRTVEKCVEESGGTAAANEKWINKENKESNMSNHFDCKITMNGLLEESTAIRKTVSVAEQPKRSMIMLGENLNKMAQRMNTRRQSSLDELDTRRHSDSGGELFSRNGLVTTTLLLATSESICGGCEHSSIYSHQQHELVAAVNSINDGSRMCATTIDDHTCSLPTSTSFSSSLDSDLTASHSNRCVRMPCKLPLKKWKRRYSLHDMPSTMAKRNNGDDDKTSADERKCLKKMKWRHDVVKVRGAGGGHSRRKALFAAFKRTKNDGGDGRKNECAGGDVGNIDERSFSPTAAVGLWRRARAMASRRQVTRRRSGSGGSLAASIEEGRHKKKGQKRAKESEGAAATETKVIRQRNCCSTMREKKGQRDRGTANNTPGRETEWCHSGEPRGKAETDTMITTIKDSGDRKGENCCPCPMEQQRKRQREEKGGGGVAADTAGGVSGRQRDEKSGADTIQIVYVTDETPL